MTKVTKKRGSKKKLGTSVKKKAIKDADKKTEPKTAEKKNVEETAGKVVDLKDKFLEIKNDIVKIFRKK